MSEMSEQNRRARAFLESTVPMRDFVAAGVDTPLAGLRGPFVLAVRAFCRLDVRCEAFDRTLLPGAFSRYTPDSWLPLDRGQMLMHAREEHEKTVRFLIRHEVSPEDMAQAKRFVDGMKLEKQEQLALSDEEFEKMNEPKPSREPICYGPPCKGRESAEKFTNKSEALIEHCPTCVGTLKDAPPSLATAIHVWFDAMRAGDDYAEKLADQALSITEVRTNISRTAARVVGWLRRVSAVNVDEAIDYYEGRK